jgi:hypothetical protein
VWRRSALPRTGFFVSAGISILVVNHTKLGFSILLQHR